MKVVRLDEAPPPGLAARLAVFEEEFTYPLGPGRSFRISHGDDYTRFFGSMGRAACFLALDGERIVGAMACVIRRLGLPGGGEVDAAYVADLKVTGAARSGVALHRLARAARLWGTPFTDKAFAVVMEGTRATPDRYTGRAGIPEFALASRTAILRVPTDLPTDFENDAGTVHYRGERELAERCLEALTVGHYHPAGGDPSRRSERAPEWLCRDDGSACARLEDTLRAKRLIALDGAEIVSAHLSSFAFRDPAAGAALILEASRRARASGVPALFASVAESDTAPILAALGRRDVTVAPARVYATGLPLGAPWIVNTSEV